MSLTMLELKYQGQEQSRDRNNKTFKETWIGDQTSIDGKIATLTIGTFTQGKGYLRSWRKSQDAGPHYILQIEFSESYGDNNGFTDDVVTGLKSAQLTTRTIQQPLEKRPNYRTNWNYMLIGKNVNYAPVDLYRDATDTKIPPQYRGIFKWVKTTSEIDYDNGWNIAGEISKPGIQFYEVSFFVCTVQSSYRSASAAGAAISKNINVVISNFEYDFGLGGQWKLDDASVRYSGNVWLGTNTYTRAIDYWDGDLYQGGGSSSSSGN